MENKIEIYTDGSCLGNPGVGGFGYIIIYFNGKKLIGKGGRKDTTNNRMELLAVIKALKTIENKNFSNKDITVYSDSNYVIKGITEWIKGWKARNFKDVKNMEMWKELDTLTIGKKIEWKWVKAHNGNLYNERVDKIARVEAEKLRF
jgi:ribonuclease HI